LSSHLLFLPRFENKLFGKQVKGLLIGEIRFERKKSEKDFS